MYVIIFCNQATPYLVSDNETDDESNNNKLSPIGKTFSVNYGTAGYTKRTWECPSITAVCLSVTALCVIQQCSQNRAAKMRPSWELFIYGGSHMGLHPRQMVNIYCRFKGAFCLHSMGITPVYRQLLIFLRWRIGPSQGLFLYTTQTLSNCRSTPIQV
jgi:hypothetical protein